MLDVIHIIPDRWDFNKTVQEVGSYLYSTGINNYIHYNDIVTIEIDSVHYLPVLDFINHVVILKEA